MQRWTRWTLALAGIVSLATVSSARALVVAPPPGPNRVAQADVVVVGRVVAHEPKDVEITLPGGAKQTYRIAIVNVSEAIKGLKEAKAVRVAFVPAPGADADPAVPAIRPIRPGIRPGFGPVNLSVGQDGLFFLTKHPKETFYTAPNYYDAVARTAPNFENEVAEAKRVAKLMDDPIASLKSANAEERLQTASLLIIKYRQVRFASGKSEPIPAEESKLILKALREGPWEVGGRFDRPNAWNLFSQLGLTEKDGWTPPKAARDVKELHRAAQEWLDKHADTYVIQRQIPGEAVGGVVPGPIGGPRPIGPPIRILPAPIGRPVPLPAPVPVPIKKLELK